MSQYLVLIYDDESAWAKVDDAYRGEMMGKHEVFGTRHADAIVGGNALDNTSTATSIRSGSTVTDGPFAETKEALGGYYLIEAADLDAAINIARDVPTISGGVEVRPIMVFS